MFLPANFFGRNSGHQMHSNGEQNHTKGKCSRNETVVRKQDDPFGEKVPMDLFWGGCIWLGIAAIVGIIYGATVGSMALWICSVIILVILLSVALTHGTLRWIEHKIDHHEERPDPSV
ncbi:MAG: hypothetical protein V4481_02065 [Patescibacteria group bacterium]